MSKFKQIAFDTVLRNPLRITDFLTVISDFEGKIMDDKNIMQVMCALYRKGLVKSPLFEVAEDTDEIF